MKSLRSFLIFSFIIASSSLFAADINQSATNSVRSTSNDLQWLTTQDTKSLLTTPADYVQAQDFERVYFQNNCSSTVAVVARYVDLNGSWVTDGAWKLAPGEKGYLFDTRNAILYFYAVSEQGHRWQGNHVVVINGYEVPMQEVRMNITGWGNFTMNLNCR